MAPQPSGQHISQSLLCVTVRVLQGQTGGYLQFAQLQELLACGNSQDAQRGPQ